MKVLYISGIILFFYYIYKNYKSNNLISDVKTLWTKYHPKDVLDKEVLKVMLENDTKIFKNLYEYYSIYDINKITDFLNKYYSIKNPKQQNPNQVFLENKMKWLYNTPHQQFNTIKHLPRNTWNIGLKQNNKLISLICIRPIKTMVCGIIMNSFWIDYECIHIQHRKNKIGSQLALKAIEEVVNSDFDNLFYIIDNRRYVQPHITEIKYYTYNLSKVKVKYNDLSLFQPSDLKNTFKLYLELIQKKKIYQLLTVNEFIYYFKPNNEFIYTFVSKKTISLIHIQCMEYKGYYIKIPIISLFLSKGNQHKELKKVMVQLRNLGFKNVIIMNTYKINRFKKKKYEGLSYIYNFNIKTKFKKIKARDFGIPIF